MTDPEGAVGLADEAEVDGHEVGRAGAGGLGDVVAVGDGGVAGGEIGGVVDEGAGEGLGDLGHVVHDFGREEAGGFADAELGTFAEFALDGGEQAFVACGCPALVEVVAQFRDQVNLTCQVAQVDVARGQSSMRKVPSRMICSSPAASPSQILKPRPTTSIWVELFQAAPVCAP